MKNIYLALITLVTLASYTVVALQWKYVPENAVVKFTLYEKEGIEEGVFTGLTGEVNFNENDLKASALNATIKVATINSGIEMRDESLRSKDFFETDKYPTIQFTSTSFIKTDTGYCAMGNLKIKAVTKLIELPFTYKKITDSTASFIGHFTINRYEYGIGTKGDGVGNIVRLDLNIPVRR